MAALGPAGRASGHVHVGGLVSGRTVDVLRRDGRRQLAPLAPEVPGRRTGADHLRTDRGGGHGAGAGRPVVGDIGRERVGARSGFTTRPANGRSRRKATPRLPAFPGMARACSISSRGTWWCPQTAGRRRHPNCARWTSLGKDRQRAAGRVGRGLRNLAPTRRKWPSRRRNSVANRRFGWRPSTRRAARADRPWRRRKSVSFVAREGKLDLSGRSDREERERFLACGSRRTDSGLASITTGPILDKFGRCRPTASGWSSTHLGQSSEYRKHDAANGRPSARGGAARRLCA